MIEFNLISWLAVINANKWWLNRSPPLLYFSLHARHPPHQAANSAKFPHIMQLCHLINLTRHLCKSHHQLMIRFSFHYSNSWPLPSITANMPQIINSWWKCAGLHLSPSFPVAPSFLPINFSSCLISSCHHMPHYSVAINQALHHTI
jgi:hypothetical protein